MTPSQLSDLPEVREEFQRIVCPDEDELDCDRQKNSAYRTVDGTCNNLENPWWGAAFTPQPRYLPSAYDDSMCNSTIYIYAN
jgi:hypothetical protein